VLIVDPFPASPIQVSAQPASVHDIERNRPTGDERAPCCFEQALHHVVVPPVALLELRETGELFQHF